MTRDGSRPDDLAELFAALSIILGVIITLIVSLRGIAYFIYGE